MKIKPLELIQQPWKVHTLLQDFRVEDVWLLPFELEQRHTLQDILAQLEETNKKIATKGLAGKLFSLRRWLGKIFHWDTDTMSLQIVHGEIRERYAKAEGRPLEDLPHGGVGSFSPVFYLEHECLLEVENKTVQAAVHFGKVPLANTKYAVHMTVYVKPKGTFGQLYMLAIKPFRLLIIYPTLLKTLQTQWNIFIQLEKATLGATSTVR
jgi:Protein of unknown function (DUF2867)